MIKPEQYSLFLKTVVDELEGDWVIIGGSLLALINSQSRLTSDIDLCPLSELTNEMRINLMKIAQSSGLNIESINPAADFFLRQIPNWKSSIVILLSGEKGNLYRPSLELYFKLKLDRATQTDIEDCISFLNWHRDNKIEFDSENLKNFVRSKINSENSARTEKLFASL